MRGLRLEPAEHFGKPAICGRRDGLRLHYGRSRNGRRLSGRDAFDHGFLPRLFASSFYLGDDIRFLRPFDQIERGRHRLALVQVVVAQALDRVVRRFEVACSAPAAR